MNKKNRFLQCFRPVTTDGSLKTGRRTDGHRGDPVFTCIAAGENEGMMFRRILPPILVEDHIDKQEEGGGDGRLSRILKAVFTANSSAKKSKKRKRGQSSFRSETKITANTVEISNSPNENSMHKQKMFDDNNLRVDSHVSSSLRSSSAFTSTSLCTSCSCSRTTSDTRSSSKRSKSFGSNSVESKQRQDSVQEYGKGCQGSNVGLCLLLISLMVLIFWGKICAIFCTSTWLFLVRWSASNESPEDGIESPKIVSDSESEEYKKKVVMEGLLKRNRARGLLTL